MQLKKLKKILNSLTKEQLEQELLYYSDYLGISGTCKVIRQPATLYYTGEYDPANLYTRKQLIEDEGMSNEEISKLDIEIPKGALVVTF